MKSILIIFGGQSNEHEISIKSAKNILKHIDHNKYIVNCVFIDIEGNWYNAKQETLEKDNKISNIFSLLQKYDIVFPILHGQYGEDGKIQGLLELAGVKYIGSSILSSALGMDKHFSKVICKNLNIPTLPWFLINGKYKIKDIESTINYPMIIKPVNSGSSIGIYIANNRNELIKNIKLAQQVDFKIIIEPFIDARELECSVLESKSLIISKVGEISHNSLFYDYDTKYLNNNTKMIIPAKINKKLEKTVREYAKTVFEEIGAKGIARIDFLLDNKNNVYFNEINTMPGFTDQSMYPRLLEKSGYKFKDILEKLINLS